GSMIVLAVAGGWFVSGVHPFADAEDASAAARSGANATGRQEPERDIVGALGWGGGNADRNAASVAARRGTLGGHGALSTPGSSSSKACMSSDRPGNRRR